MMINKRQFPIFTMIVLFGLGWLLTGCDNGIETSPSSGTLRVTLESDPADTTITIVNETIHVSPEDLFLVTIFQGKAYNDSTYATLYVVPEAYRELEITYNVIRSDGGSYERFVIFETQLPPFEFDRIQFGITPSFLKLGNFEIPVQSPADADLFENLPQTFKISENKVTEIRVQLSPFKSVQRYRDTYQFIPQLKIIDVTYY